MVAVLVGASCSKESLETIPVVTSFEAPDSALARYVQQLETSEYGWEFGLAGQQTGYYAGYLDFSSSNTAQFIADDVAADGLRGTAYRLAISGANPTLSFPSGAFAQFATALIGVDTAFSFQAIRQDTVFLLGNQYGSELVLTKATATRAQAYEDGGLLQTKATVANLVKLPLYFKRLVVNGAEYDLHFRPDLKALYIHYGGTERFRIHETYYGVTATGLRLQKPLVDGINVISYLDALTVDLQTAELSVVVNGTPALLTNEATPSAYDVTAAQMFYDNPPRQIIINYSDGQGGVEQVTERFSRSLEGFTVAGEADAYGLKNISGFQYFMYVHKLARQDYGAGWFIANNTLSGYGPGVLRQYSTTGGLIRFVYLGSFGPPPAEITDIVNNTAAAFTDDYGFYVVRSGAATYDLVSVNISSGQKWIRFE